MVPTGHYRKHIRLQGAAPDAAKGVNLVYHTCAFLKSKESECQNIPRALDRRLQTFWVLHYKVIFWTGVMYINTRVTRQ